ncbi:helix-turn-helix domain-containing protein [Parapedobacter tibetensis]|uniref:helix-turn-helix domain-containing protein n=1 Tax=Parapedobacter tibetensis TaxID=2972951 RepID=UPI00214DA23B|nr:helix-turn-helix domain-containing protein [Parapedobacter tibetensis]
MHYIIYQLLQCSLRIEKLVDGLSQKQDQCCQCRREVSLPHDGQANPEIGKPGDASMATEETYNRVGAALFLKKSEKQVYRYRIDGDLPYFLDEKNHIRYRHAELVKLFIKLWGFPPKDGSG